MRWLQDWLQGPASAAEARARARLAAVAWPGALRAVLARLAADGHQALLVGGTVRDRLLDREAGGAFDVATDRTPDQVSGLFPRVEPTGLRHGTVLILADGLRVECTTFRTETGYSDARRPDAVAFTTDPLLDLDRRDLTVNAMAWDPAALALLDPHHGALDLERRRLRAVGEPLDRFREDALRPLRVARFTATLEMEADGALARALQHVRDPESAVRFEAVSMERVRDELTRMLEAPRPSRGFEVLRAAGLLEVWLPELQHCVGVPQNRFHAWDVYRHSLMTCDAAPKDKPRVRWAALLHDIGKPDTRREVEGEGTFHQHEQVGAELADRLLARLRMPGEDRAAIVHLIREHMFDYRPEWSDAAVRRWLKRVTPASVADLFDVRIADTLGNGKRAGFPASLEGLRRRVTALIEARDALEVSDLAVDGHDVMRELGIPPGPEVRATLEGLLDEVLERPERNRREVLIERLRQSRRGNARTS